jgi:hypothetical protein
MAIKKKIDRGTAAKKVAEKKDFSVSYNRYKLYGGRPYTGMKVGRGHKWYYDKGIWIDKKLTPDKWQIKYEVKKRRAGKAPEGSGAPVGTEYHWYILAHQLVKKLDANTYSTAMNGFKFKLAHKRSNKEEWNINEKSQRKQLIRIMKNFIAELESGEIEEVEMPPAIVSPARTGKKILKKKTAKRKSAVKKKSVAGADI